MIGTLGMGFSAGPNITGTILIVQYILEVGRYRLQEHWCIISKVSWCSDVSLLRSIRSLSTLYDHYITESDKIISWSIDSKLLPYCTRVFLLQNVFETFIHYRKHFIDPYIMILWYINALILNLQYRYTHWNIMQCNAPMHHSIVPSLIHAIIIKFHSLQ